MNKPILIVRSVSIEKSSHVFDLCKARWPQHPLWVVTLPGREGEMMSDDRITNVIIYEASEGVFCEPFTINQGFEAVVIPVGNSRGWGYTNIYRAFFEIRTKGYYYMAYCKHFKRISKLTMRLRAVYELFLGKIVNLMTIYLGYRIYQEIKGHYDQTIIPGNQQKLDLVDQNR